MAKSIRSKWKRKCRAVKRVRYGEKELARLNKTLGVDKQSQDVEMSSLAKIATVVSRSQINKANTDASNEMDVDKKRIFNPKTMRDQNGSYPVWMHQRRIRKSKNVEKQKKKKTKKKH